MPILVSVTKNTVYCLASKLILLRTADRYSILAKTTMWHFSTCNRVNRQKKQQKLKQNLRDDEKEKLATINNLEQNLLAVMMFLLADNKI